MQSTYRLAKLNTYHLATLICCSKSICAFDIAMKALMVRERSRKVAFLSNHRQVTVAIYVPPLTPSDYDQPTWV